MPAITALEARDMIHAADLRNISKLMDKFFDEVAVPQLSAGSASVSGILEVPIDKEYSCRYGPGPVQDRI